MKSYYTISEVADIVGVKPHVLRYWEATLKVPSPKRRAGKRFYSQKDVKMAFLIKILLYKHGYTLEKVSRMLKEEGAEKLYGLLVEPIVKDVKKELETVLDELTEIISKLEAAS